MNGRHSNRVTPVLNCAGILKWPVSNIYSSHTYYTVLIRVHPVPEVIYTEAHAWENPMGSHLNIIKSRPAVVIVTGVPRVPMVIAAVVDF